MSKRNESLSKVYCFKNECAFWDEERGQCCIKTIALAATRPQADITPASELQVTPNKLEYDTTKITSGGRIDYDELSRVCKGGFSQL